MGNHKNEWYIYVHCWRTSISPRILHSQKSPRPVCYCENICIDQKQLAFCLQFFGIYLAAYHAVHCVSSFWKDGSLKQDTLTKFVYHAKAIHDPLREAHTQNIEIQTNDKLVVDKPSLPGTTKNSRTTVRPTDNKMMASLDRPCRIFSVYQPKPTIDKTGVPKKIVDRADSARTSQQHKRQKGRRTKQHRRWGSVHQEGTWMARRQRHKELTTWHWQTAHTQCWRRASEPGPNYSSQT